MYNNYKTHKFTVHYKQLIQICKEIKILQHYLVIINLFLDKKKLLTGVYLVIYYLVSKFYRQPIFAQFAPFHPKLLLGCAYCIRNYSFLENSPKKFLGEFSRNEEFQFINVAKERLREHISHCNVYSFYEIHEMLPTRGVC